MKKRTLSMLLAGAMTMGVIGSASAATTPQATHAQTITEAGLTGATTGSADVDLTGEITDKAVLLSVVVPTKIDFIVATKQAASGAVIADRKGSGANALGTGGTYYVFNGLISGTGVVTNNSNVPIKLEITDIRDTSNLTTLMDLAMSSSSLAGGDALKAPFDLSKTYGTTPILLASSIPINGGTADLKVVGKGAKGNTSNGDGEVHLPNGTYTVTTTLKVSEA